MAKLKVSELTRTANVTGADLVYIVQGINSRATTVANLLQAANALLVGPAGPPGPAGGFGPAGPPGPTGPAASPTTEFDFTANDSANAYFVFGSGYLDNIDTPNPPLYLYRGRDYAFYNASGNTHPLLILESANGNVFSSVEYFVNFNPFSNVEVTFFTVPYFAPSTLYYQSNANPQLGNVIYIT
jgi:hypothetical protein